MNQLPDIWNEFVNAGKVDQVCALYAANARLLATFSTLPVDDKNGIRDYFTGFTSRSGAGVSFDLEGKKREEFSSHLVLYTGTYTFFHGEGTDRQEFPARYSFLVDESSDSKILHHHSSLIPAS